MEDVLETEGPVMPGEDPPAEDEFVMSRERSEEFAMQFELFKLGLNVVDWDYARLVVKKLRSQVDFQKTMAIFNPSYPLKKNDVIALQAAGLEKLCEGVELLMQVDEGKKEVEREIETRDELAKMFL